MNALKNWKSILINTTDRSNTIFKDTEFMKLAIGKAILGIDQGQTPFGACLVKDGRPVVSAHNVVWATTDITAHAEINVIRQACAQLQTVDLSGCTIYSTCEPCPMCFSAIHWANIGRIVYGVAISDAKAAGFDELEISNGQLKDLGRVPIHIEGGILKDECIELFARWQLRPGHQVY